jgi:hypothetical protein
MGNEEENDARRGGWRMERRIEMMSMAAKRDEIQDFRKKTEEVMKRISMDRQYFGSRLFCSGYKTMALPIVDAILVIVRGDHTAASQQQGLLLLAMELVSHPPGMLVDQQCIPCQYRELVSSLVNSCRTWCRCCVWICTSHVSLGIDAVRAPLDALAQMKFAPPNPRPPASPTRNQSKHAVTTHSSGENGVI